MLSGPVAAPRESRYIQAMFSQQQALRGHDQTLSAALLAASVGPLPAALLSLLLRGRAQ